MTRCLLLLWLLGAACAVSPPSVIEGAIPETPSISRLYPLPAPRLMEITLESLWGMKHWSLVGLDPSRGRIECRAFSRWPRGDYPVGLEFLRQPDPQSTLLKVVVNQPPTLFNIEDSEEIAEELFHEIDRRVDLP